MNPAAQNEGYVERAASETSKASAPTSCDAGPISIGYSGSEIAKAHGRTVTDVRAVRSALRDELKHG
jgi:hypothetical protein